jgi:hypothetical protein
VGRLVGREGREDMGRDLPLDVNSSEDTADSVA